MGMIRSIARDIADRELEIISTHREWYRVSLHDIHDARAIEFEIAIDSVVNYEYPGLAKEQQLHVLRVGPIEIGFEACFMDWSFVAGSFPTECLRVVFLAHRAANSDGLWEDATGANWVVAYYWEGQSLPVEQVPYEGEPKRSDGILPVYRIAAMQRAETMLRAAT